MGWFVSFAPATTEVIEDDIAALIDDSNSIDWTYNDGAGSLAGEVIVSGMTDSTTTPTLLSSLQQVTALLGGIALTSDGSRYVYATGSASSGNSEFQIWDIQNPASPVKNSTLAFTGDAPQTAAVISGGYAFLGYVGSAALPNKSIIDIRNPNAPTSVFQSANTNSTMHNIKNGVQGKYWYLLDQSNANVLTYDVSDVTAPVLLSTVAIGTSTPVGGAIQGRYLYVTCNSGRLVIFDLNVPGTPASVASIATGGSSTSSIDVSGKVAAVCRTTGTGNVELYDVSDPTTPVIIGSAISMVSPSVRVYFVGRYLHVTGGSSAATLFYKILDVSNPSSPSLAATYVPSQLNVSGATAVGCQSFYLGNRAYIATRATGNSSFEVVNLKGLELRSGYVDSLELGEAYVRGDVWARNLDARGAISAGDGGVKSKGGIYSDTEVQSPIHRGDSFRSDATNPASAGVLRLGNTETVQWRNAANDGNETFGLDADDRLYASGDLFSDGNIVVNGYDPISAAQQAALALPESLWANSIIQAATTSADAGINAFRGNGTFASPDYLDSGDFVWYVYTAGYNGTGIDDANLANINIQATEDHSSNVLGTAISFDTIANGSGSIETTLTLQGKKVATPGYFQVTAENDPGAQSNSAAIGGTAIDGGNTSLHVRTHQAVVAQVLLASTHTLRVKINGTEYNILLSDAPDPE